MTSPLRLWLLRLSLCVGILLLNLSFYFSVWGFEAATTTQLTTRYFKTKKLGTHLLSNAAISIHVNNLIPTDRLNGSFETLWTLTPQNSLDLYVYELTYQTPYIQDQFSLEVGRQFLSYGFFPLLADAAHLYWKGTSWIKGSLYGGTAYFENELAFKNLPWNPLAGVFFQIKPAETWEITPAVRYIKIQKDPFTYTTLNLSKAWPLSQSTSPTLAKYPWYKSSGQLGQFISEVQAEYEMQSQKITGVLGQLHYTVPEGIHVRTGVEYFKQPLLLKLANHKDSVMSLFGLTEITEAFVATTYPLLPSMALSPAYSQHFYPTTVTQTTQRGHLATLDGLWTFHEGDDLSWQLRYYTGLGGWLLGSSLGITKQLWSRFTESVMLDLDRYHKINGIEALSIALRQQLTWELSRPFRTEWIIDLNRNHQFALNFSTLARIVYEYN